MTIEGLGKKFQEARLARNLTLEEAARMTKIRPQRLAEIEGDDFSQFPSLAYAKGFLLIYGKFLDVDVTPYLDAFDDSESVTVDGYSYLQENERAKPVSAPVARRRPAATGPSNRVSPVPLIVGIVVLVVGFLGMKFLLNVQRLAPGRGSSSAQTSSTATPAVASGGNAPLGVENLGGAVEAYLSSHFSGFPNGVPPPGLYHRILKEIEVPLLTAALAATRGNQIRAADLLGLNRNTLRKKIRDLDIQVYRSGG